MIGERRFTNDEAKQIREAHAAGESQSAIGRRLGVAQGVIHHIVTGYTYRDAPGPIAKTRQHLTNKQVRQIRKLADKGVNQNEIARRFGTSPPVVNRLILGIYRVEAGGPIREGGPRRGLTDAQVVELRERFAAGERQVRLAEAYGLSPTGVANIVRGVHRRDAGGPITPRSTRA